MLIYLESALISVSGNSVNERLILTGLGGFW